MSITAFDITYIMIVWSISYSIEWKRRNQSSVLLALCERNPPMAGGFPTQRTSNAGKTAGLCKQRACNAGQCFHVMSSSWPFNTLRLRQNDRHFQDDFFKWIFLNENVWISINISLKFVPKGPINNILTLVQVMARCPPGNKPLSEPRTVRLPTHICVARPQWVKTSLKMRVWQNINWRNTTLNHHV